VAPLLGVPAAEGSPAEAAPAPGCPDVIELFSRHLEGEISASLCADLEKHLDGCPACRARCDSLRRTLALCKAAPLPEVPSAVQADVRRALRRFVGPYR
jgi:RNA polymerase sigma-70 factor (ECF subfamily)